MAYRRQRAPIFNRVIACMLCGAAVANATRVQKYCAACSEVKSTERRRKWASTNRSPETPEQVLRSKRAHLADRDGIMERGALISQAEAQGAAWLDTSKPNIINTLQVVFPFSYKLSKNRILSQTHHGGHVFLRKESRANRDALILLIKASAQSSRLAFHQGKVWIDILVQKPDHNGDAVNVIDLVCDAIKEAIGVDDRWFSIRRLDWQIVKMDPQIYIGIGQEITEPHRICSACGQARTFEHFRGMRRICFGCGRKPKPATRKQVLRAPELALVTA